MLIHILDVSGSEGRDPWKDFLTINTELELYSPRLAEKKQIVAGNKIDLVEGPQQIEDLKKKVEEAGYEFFPICTLTGEGVLALMEKAWQILQETPAIPEFTPDKTIVYICICRFSLRYK